MVAISAELTSGKATSVAIGSTHAIHYGDGSLVVVLGSEFDIKDESI